MDEGALKRGDLADRSRGKPPGNFFVWFDVGKLGGKDSFKHGPSGAPSLSRTMDGRITEDNTIMFSRVLTDQNLGMIATGLKRVWTIWDETRCKGKDSPEVGTVLEINQCRYGYHIR